MRSCRWRRKKTLKSVIEKNCWKKLGVEFIKAIAKTDEMWH